MKRIIHSILTLALLVSNIAFGQNCDLSGFKTFTQGGWGSKNNSNSAPGGIREQYFNQIFGNSGLVVGTGRTLTLATSSDVEKFLPQGGTASSFTSTYYNTTTTTTAGVLGGQLVALALNIYYDDASKLGTNSLKLRNLVVVNGSFAGKTVSQVFDIANRAVGGISVDYSYSTINDALTAINENFDNGSVNKGYLTCPSTSKSSDLSVIKTVDKSALNYNDIVNYTIKVKNDGPDAATGVVVTDILPKGFVYISSTPANVYNYNTGVWTVGSIANGATSQLVISARIVKDSMKVGAIDLGPATGYNVFALEDVDVTSDAEGKVAVGRDAKFANYSVGLKLTQASPVEDVLIAGRNLQFSGGTIHNGNVVYGGESNLPYDRVTVLKGTIRKGSVIDFNAAKTYLLNLSKKISGYTANGTSVFQYGGYILTGTNPYLNVFNISGDNLSKITYMNLDIPKGSLALVNIDGKLVSWTGGLSVLGSDRTRVLYNFYQADSLIVSNIGIEGCLLAPNAGVNFNSGAINGQYIVKASRGGGQYNYCNFVGFNSQVKLTNVAEVTGSDNHDPDSTPGNGDPKEDDRGTVDVTVNIKDTTTVGYDLIKINSVCSSDPAVTRNWKIVNPYQVDITCNWLISGTQQSGTVVAKANAETSLSTNTQGTNTLEIYVSGKLITSKVSSGEVCYVPKFSDLSLAKEVSTQYANNGDNVLFTITVKNSGPDDATGVVVSDILPKGLVFVSATPAGQYDKISGKWTIGKISNGSSAQLKISTTVNSDSMKVGGLDLGPATGYNVFVLEDIKQPSSDTEGKMAVGGNASLSNYSVGDKLPQSSEDVLVVGKDLIFTSGAVYNGNAVYGRYTNMPNQLTGMIGGGQLRKDSVINFTTAKTYLQNLSTKISAYKANGKITYANSGYILKGNNPYLNVFSLAGKDLSTSCSVDISIPTGSVALINIDGKYVKWTGGLTVLGVENTNVLYNFYEADSVYISGIAVKGSILAPFSKVNFESGVQYGQMIAKALKGQGQYNLDNFVGNVPLEKTVINIAEVINSDNTDPDSTPNNGIQSEDDYSKVSFTVNLKDTNSTGGSTNGAVWKQISNFDTSEIIWSLIPEKDGSILAGTWGGNIYKTLDGGKNWTKLFNNFSAGFVWSLVQTPNKLFAGTEKGIFNSTDNGKTWSYVKTLTTTNDTLDVRTLAFDSKNNSLYAGVWGKGVFKSTDEGLTWSEKNNGIKVKAIHSLAIGSKSELYAATFSEGVLKSTDGGDSWLAKPISYKNVWAIATEGNNVYAGTFGEGVFKSADNGESWTKANNGITSGYIYAVVTDSAKNVYVHSWNAGVFSSSNAGTKWASYGLEESNVSSIMTNPASKKVYAGTTNGTFYELVSAPNGIENKNIVPETFSVEQNYPNPFNPETTIKYTIPQASNVKLTVYNVLGQVVKVVVNEFKTAGSYKVRFNANEFASGVYIYKLDAGKFSKTMKMMLLK